MKTLPNPSGLTNGQAVRFIGSATDAGRLRLRSTEKLYVRQNRSMEDDLDAHYEVNGREYVWVVDDQGRVSHVQRGDIEPWVEGPDPAPPPSTTTAPAGELFKAIDEGLLVRNPTHFYLTVHGVEGIRLRVDSHTIDRDVLRVKLAQFIEVIQRELKV